jgi:hypothetical protein
MPNNAKHGVINMRKYQREANAIKKYVDIQKPKSQSRSDYMANMLAKLGAGEMSERETVKAEIYDAIEQMKKGKGG